MQNQYHQSLFFSFSFDVFHDSVWDQVVQLLAAKRKSYHFDGSSRPFFGRHCWWLKSCTTWDVWNPINNGINYQPQLVSRISAINSTAFPGDFSYSITSPFVCCDLEAHSRPEFEWVSRIFVQLTSLYFVEWCFFWACGLVPIISYLLY